MALNACGDVARGDLARDVRERCVILAPRAGGERAAHHDLSGVPELHFVISPHPAAAGAVEVAEVQIAAPAGAPL